jgi:hypothetical protein
VFSHIFIGVQDFDRALAFYRALMPRGPGLCGRSHKRRKIRRTAWIEARISSTTTERISETRKETRSVWPAMHHPPVMTFGKWASLELPLGTGRLGSRPVLWIRIRAETGQIRPAT